MLDTCAFACEQVAASGTTLKATGGRVWGVFSKGVSSPHDIIIRDGGASGAIKYRYSPPNSGAVSSSHSFHIPIEFKTNIYVEYSGGTNIPTASILYE